MGTDGVAMKTEMIDFKIPDWALCYIFNGDDGQLTDQEKYMVDRFIIDNNIIGTSIKQDEETGEECEAYFSASNDIGGLACNVYDCVCLCEIKPKK